MEVDTDPVAGILLQIAGRTHGLVACQADMTQTYRVWRERCKARAPNMHAVPSGTAVVGGSGS